MKIKKKIKKILVPYDSMLPPQTRDQLLSPSSEREPHKNAETKIIILRTFLGKKNQENGPSAEKGQNRKSNGLSRRTRERGYS